MGEIRPSKLLIVYLPVLFLLVYYVAGCSNVIRDEPVISSDLKNYQFLSSMLSDDYYPKHLVAEGAEILQNLCKEIEVQKPKTVQALYLLTHTATNSFNELAEKFEEHGSEFETVARELVAEEFMLVAKTYGFDGANIEELIATRDW